MSNFPLLVMSYLVNFLCSPHNADRERIMRSFKLAGLVGAYNVLAIVRGGGTTGQSGAVALGIAKGLAAHAPEVQALLKKGSYQIICLIYS